MEDKRRELKNEELKKVAGGSVMPSDERRELFEQSYKDLVMESSGFSGIKRGEYYDKWNNAK